MNSAQYFSIFAPENEGRNDVAVLSNPGSESLNFLTNSSVFIHSVNQLNSYDPLFRLCHYRRVKAP